MRFIVRACAVWMNGWMQAAERAGCEIGLARGS